MKSAGHVKFGPAFASVITTFICALAFAKTSCHGTRVTLVWFKPGVIVSVI